LNSFGFSFYSESEFNPHVNECGLTGVCMHINSVIMLQLLLIYVYNYLLLVQLSHAIIKYLKKQIFNEYSSYEINK